MDCIACSTAALAVQLVVTLNEMPDDEVRAELDAAMAKLDGLDELTTIDLSDIYDQIKAVEAEVLTILVSHGLVDEVTTTEASASASPTAAPSAAAVASDSPSPDPVSPEPSASDTSAEESSPSPDASATSSPTP
jgi:hypothetical protein